jgi:hypothetical protein
MIVKNAMRFIPGGHVEMYLFNRRGEIAGFALIDVEDAERVAAHRWSLGSRYVESSTAPEKYLHRFLMRPPPGMEVDHLNRRALDNRRNNLRLLAHDENGQNRAAFREHLPLASGHRGVTFDKRSRRWRVVLTVNRVRHQLGHFTTEDEAAKAAADFRREHMPFAHEDQAATPASSRPGRGVR